ncbi:hypothetical protein [Alteromonas sp. MmMcT2-5]|uniref:hypothetical protein n=1 Tax=Alteromonas sp. MmMcT2-5 TaxID=2917733 RepID=UPI001EF1AA60|nr:hypothetical protein [Alteromonas sp. MmMcT2-5]MCG7650992.1 hypothetical protein [Alteromonas sp. MmMcT2-5]
MENVIFTSSQRDLPPLDSSAYRLLQILADGRKYPRDYLCSQIGGGFRAYLQQLKGDKFNFWLIHTEIGVHAGRKQNFYWLDERHFSQDWELDKNARIISKKEYKDRSFSVAKLALRRVEKAREEKAKADEEYFKTILSRKSAKG